MDSLPPTAKKTYPDPAFCSWHAPGKFWALHSRTSWPSDHYHGPWTTIWLPEKQFINLKKNDTSKGLQKCWGLTCKLSCSLRIKSALIFTFSIKDWVASFISILHMSAINSSTILERLSRLEKLFEYRFDRCIRFWYFDLTWLTFDLSSCCPGSGDELIDVPNDSEPLLFGSPQPLDKLLELLWMEPFFSAYFSSFSKLLKSFCWNCYKKEIRLKCLNKKKRIKIKGS